MLHSYVLYPLILTIAASLKKFDYEKFSLKGTLPMVHIFIAAYNEEAVIGEKLKSIISCNYPADQLVVWVGSDNSTDATDGIVQSFSESFKALHLIAYSERQGKANILNDLFKKALTSGSLKGNQNEIIILTDANVIFEKNALHELVIYFKDEKVGLVGATILNEGARKDGISIQEKTYIMRENKIKYLEGKAWGTMMGAFGACYAIRANLFPAIPKTYLMEDFYITMHVLSNKYKTISNPEAICFEDVSNKMEIEFNRKVRISSGNYQNLGSYYKLLWPPYRYVGFSFLSHKVLRWLGPFFIFIMAATLTLLAQGNKLYLVMLILLGFIFIIPLVDVILKRLNIHSLILRFISYFMVMNLALLVGFFKYIGGIKSNVWQPTQRNQ